MNEQDEHPRAYLGLQALQGPAWTRHRGFPRYVRDHALSLLRYCPELIGGLVLDSELLTPKDLASFCGYDLLQYYSPAGEQPLPHDLKPNIYHVMSPFFPYRPLRHMLPPPFNRGRTKLMVTLYDLIPLVFPHLYLPLQEVHRRRNMLVQQADHVLALSRGTRDDAINLLGLKPERITVIYGGVSDYFRPAAGPLEAVRAQVMERIPAIQGPYILSIMFTHEFGKRKNLEGAIEGYARLPKDLRDGSQLVIIGHGVESDYAGLVAHAKKNRVKERVIFPGLVPDDLLRDLYRACDLLIFPSLYVGRGLPVLEAMRCRAPTFVSDRPALDELVEIDDARFDPEDPADIARLMERTLTDGDFQRYLREYGLQQSMKFTWDRVAQVTADCYREVGASTVQRRISPIERTRFVAFCTPLPPEHSDVADYGGNFLQALCNRHPVRVDVVVKGDPESYVPQNHRAINLVSARQFRWLAEHGHYDDIIYCMGNSPLYGLNYELLKERPGIVWLHDVRLTDFYQWYYRRSGRDRSTLPHELRPWADRYPDYESGLLTRDTLTKHEQGIYLAGEVASYAQKIVVNSRFSRELVELESGGSVPVIALPYAAPPANGAPPSESWPLLASKYGLDQFASLVICNGYITPLKCPEAVIDAFAAAASADRSLALAFVGPCEPEYQRQLEQRASQLGIQDRVLFTGYVDEAELDSWLAAACCAIQMRFPTGGESSGAVMRCLAAGVPTIVTDHGPLRELPDDAAVKVPAQVEPDVLAQTISGLLADDEACARLREGALRHAHEASFEAVADQFWTKVLCAP